MWAFSSCVMQASHCCDFFCCQAEAPESGFSGCGTQALLPRGMWDHPRPGIELVSLALAGRSSITGPSGQSKVIAFKISK